MACPASAPAQKRTVIVLRYYEDLSELEIAAVMGTSAGTVNSQSARSLRHLAQLLSAPGSAMQPSKRSET